ncbi:hypothetical protein GGS26DRAFT_507131 [Hypomontagnella submonticulosa]|nr:hypothetical protein GGS26DRAFT_507131 [Hypomontagnella submonticulosa]
MASPLLEVPLHIVAIALGHLDTIQQLYPIILSHRIFRDALDDNLHSVARKIIIKQIPANMLPFTITVLKSSRIRGGDHEATSDLLAQLEAACSGTIELALPHPSSLSFSDYGYISRNYAAAESLARSLANEVTPIVTERLKLTRLRPKVTGREGFRLKRAFLRYQLMCNLFCPVEKPFANTVETKENLERFFSTFSPWVNEQLTCAFDYLVRKIRDALDNVFAHDVSWVTNPIPNQNGLKSDSKRREDVQSLLVQGLPLLNSVIRAKTCDERARLLRSDDSPARRRRWYPGLRLKFMTDWGIETERRIDLYRVQELKRLVRPSDSRVDSTSSSSCNIWLGAHRTCSSVDETMWNNDDWMFRECGYVFWDYTSVALNFGSIRRALYVKRPHFKKRDREWRQDDLSRSWTRRNDIRLAGGSGFWPWNGLNFSRIRGLDEETIRELQKKWREEEAGEEDEKLTGIQELFATTA